MKQTVFQRIMAFLGNKQLSVNALSKMINMSQTTLNTQLKGERALTASVVEKFLIAFPDVSAEWLLRGKGNMLLEDTDGFAKPQNETSQQKPSQDDGIWQAKYEELEKRYDQLLSILGGTMGKRNVS